MCLRYKIALKDLTIMKIIYNTLVTSRSLYEFRFWVSFLQQQQMLLFLYFEIVKIWKIYYFLNQNQH